METLKNSFIGIGVPCFPCGYIDTFDSLALGCFHGTFKQQAEALDRLFGFWRHSIRKTLVKYPLPHLHKLIFQRYFIGVKNFQNGIHYLRTNAISFSNGNSHIYQIEMIIMTRAKIASLQQFPLKLHSLIIWACFFNYLSL